MKRVSFIILVCTMFMYASQVYAQEKCKVLKKDIKGEYIGECKDGLANGNGVSIGENTYKGKFKNGLPNGRGIIIYDDGSRYIGEFKKGLRHGDGKYVINIEGKESVSEGKWGKDKYIGKKKKKSHEVTYNRGVPRYVIRKVGNDINRVTVFVRNNGGTYKIFSNTFNGDSGVKYSSSDSVVYENITKYPFKGRLEYTIPSKFFQGSTRVRFEFEILEPGDWVVTLNH